MTMSNLRQKAGEKSYSLLHVSEEDMNQAASMRLTF